MTELLVEVGCEELPAGWLDPVTASFGERWNAELEAAGIAASAVRCYATPRRLVAHAAGVKARQPDRVETTLGPPARVGRDEEGGWTRAALGFARRLGLEGRAAEEALTLVETPRGPYVGLRVEVPGRAAMELAPGMLERVLRATAFPTTMRWDAAIGGEPFPFGRPIRWLVALLGGEVVPFRIEVAGGDPVVAGRWSRGHRFRSRVGEPGAPFEVEGFDALRDGLRERFVVLDPDERKEQLAAALLAAAAGGRFRAPDGHHQLVEWPGAVAGHYPGEFLSLPEEIRSAVLIHHQKYLPEEESALESDGEGGRFLAVVNMPDDPDGAMRRGAERVVRARLRDAAFFWEEALGRPLDERGADLERVVFHRRIGHLRDHSERVARLAGWIAGEVGADPGVAERVAGLARADLTTSLVGEFPSLQGIAGGRILEAQGETAAVWKAVRDHYRPTGRSRGLPETIEGAAAALADRASTLVGLFAAGEAPSGSGDPFGLRRAALGMLAILRDAPEGFPDHPSGWPTPADLLERALSEPAYAISDPEEREAVWPALLGFVSDRLLHALVPEGGSAAAARAVLAVRGAAHPVADCSRRIRALEGALASGEYGRLAAAEKRARRILPAEMCGPDRPKVQPGLLAESAERGLFAELDRVTRSVDRLGGESRYEEAFAAIASLAPRVDAFFDEVLVMAEDPDLRRNRLALLADLDALFREVGDLGQIGAAAEP